MKTNASEQFNNFATIQILCEFKINLKDSKNEYVGVFSPKEVLKCAKNSVKFVTIAYLRLSII